MPLTHTEAKERIAAGLRRVNAITQVFVGWIPMFITRPLVTPIALIFSQLAVAQSSTSQTQDQIEVIVVNAQKRQQDIRDVAVAVTLIDGEQIARQHIKDTTQLAALAPNMKSSKVAGEGTAPSFNIRGIGMFDYNTSTVSPIAIYADEVVSGGANFLDSTLYDIQRVEVLRGPQGTLFGRNTTGGAILLTSVLPQAEFSGYARASVAEQDYRALQGAVNVPLADNTAARLAFNHVDYDYSIQNLDANGQDGGMRQNSVRLLVASEWENASLLFKLYSEDWQGAPKPIYSAGILKASGTGARCLPDEVGSRSCVDSFGFAPATDDFWQTEADTADKRHDTDSWGASIQWQWQVNQRWSLKSITAHKDLERFHSFDSDGPGNFIEGSLGSDNQFFSQEISASRQGENSHWMAGLFYLQEELKQQNDLDLFRDFRANPATAGGAVQFFYHNTLENQSFSVFSQLDYNLSPDWIVTAGLRFTDDSTEYHAIADMDVVGAYIPGVWDLRGEVDDREWSGKLALVQKLSSRTSLYYSYSRGYKSGGYNGGFASSEAQAVDSEYAPERLNAWEVGARLQLPQWDMNLDLAAFWYRYQDQQVFINRTTGLVPYHVLKNGGDSRIQGLELSLAYTPVSQLMLDLNIGYLPKAELGEYQEEDLYVAGTQLPFTSEWNISALVQYEINLAGGRLLSQLGFDYQSDFYFDQNENPYLQQQGYSLWHGRIAYQPNAQWEVALWAKNLFNRQYHELKFDSIAALSAVTELRGEARQLGVELSYHF
ncbi:TonB-dependent receptor [Bowmanella denitrificans]|uniref:TonB-dependent receptor n=1 Tax=Bowmanella denitrificans TaxID=366582 RepID=UPI000C9CBD5A|nr:TonB-dependent receptor [Bowmanella denitrificans]